MSAEYALLVVKLIINVASLALSLICLFWLLKVKRNAKDEPDNRLKYYFFEDITIDLTNLYTPDEFCYKHYQIFIDKGTIEDFNIHMKKIEQFSLALLVLLVISLLVKIIHTELDWPNSCIITCCSRMDKSYKIFQAIIHIINLLASILSFIFFFLISVYYFNSSFDDFEEFSDCEYLNSRFKKDYDFVNVVKKKYLRTFIGYLVVLFLNFSHMIITIVLLSFFKIEEK